MYIILRLEAVEIAGQLKSERERMRCGCRWRRLSISKNRMTSFKIQKMKI
jgi:hypothetical protein